MKPSWLELENIGPFVKRTRVNMDSIEEGGLFLISGPTGSGKSFIFDTICYALYGKTRSGRDKNLKSDHAPIGDEPKIRFRFRIDDALYLVERTLEYKVYKKNGDTTTRTEKATLVKLVPDGSGGYEQMAIASKKSDVKTEIARILGLEMEQFSRVMMIPQGEFRELLRADTDKREGLLRQLFDSLLYKELTDSIDQRSKKLYTEIKEEITRKDTVVTTILEKLSLDAGPGDGMNFSEWSRDVLLKLEESQLQFLKKEEEKKNTWEKAMGRLETARSAFRISEELENARKKKGLLEAQERDEISNISLVLILNRKAHRLRPDLVSLDGSSKDRISLMEEVKAITSLLENTDKEFEGERKISEMEMPVKQKELEGSRNRLSRLESISPRVEEMSTYRLELNEKRGRCDELVKERTRIQDLKKVLDGNLRSIRDKIEKLVKREDMVRLSHELSAGRDLAKILQQIEFKVTKMEKFGKEKKDLNERVISQREKVESLRKRREGTLAGELARGLTTGQKCPVCGSIEHPSPRPPTVEDVSLEDVKKGSSLLQELIDDLEKIKIELNTLDTSRNELLERQEEISRAFSELAGKGSLEIMETVLFLEKKKAQLEQRDRREDDLNKEKEKLSNELEVLKDQEAPLGKEIEELNLEIKGLSSTINERSLTFRGLDIDLESRDIVSDLRLTISELRDKENSLVKEISQRSERMEELKGKLIELKEKLKLKIESLELTTRRIEKDQAEIICKLDKIDMDGLRDLNELRKALLDEKMETELTHKVEDFKKEKIQVVNSINTLEKNFRELGDGIKVLSEDEMEGVRDHESTAKAEWKMATEIRATAESDLTWTKGQLEKVVKASSEIEEMERTFKMVGKLSMQVKGLGNPRMSLERFFLAQRFEEVLISSNHRLSVLSGNRFMLKRADETEMGKRAKVGLDLNVFDNWTGQERPANTLSGGQMFLSSLALALGLADVVQSRSGGIRMDALFIDEGFGSLDEETLQTALKVLSELRHGRMVGVISHIGELKRQIRTGFEVVPSPSGSFITSIHS